MKHKDLLLISHLRKNARAPMTKISKQTSIPVSTIFDKLKEYDRDIITKHTSLLNFKGLGYDVKAHLLLKVEKQARDALLNYLKQHPSINSIFRINNGYDYLIEAVFKNLQELNDFYEEVDGKGVQDKQEYFILEDIAREQFLSYQPGFELLRRKGGFPE